MQSKLFYYGKEIVSQKIGRLIQCNQACQQYSKNENTLFSPQFDVYSKLC